MMQTKYVLDQASAMSALEASMAHAKSLGLAVAIAVVDDGGHPLAALRMDGVAPVSAYIAQEKARTAAVARRESKLFEDEINAGRFAFLSAPVQGALEGGVPVILSGQTIAAIGVAGCKPEASAAIAKAGVASINQTS